MSKTSSPLDRFLSAFSLVSRIPVAIRFSWDQSGLDFYLPLVGVPVAAFASGSLYTALALGASPIFASLAWLAVQYFAFNLFHLDGLMDSADALLGQGDKEKKLAILKDSRIGVYAFFVGFLYMSVKIGLFTEIAKKASSGEASLVAFLFVYPISGRLAGALVPAFVPPARTEGLGVKAAGARVPRALFGATIGSLIVWIGGASGSAIQGGDGFVSLSARFGLSWLILVVSAFAAAGATARAYRKAVGGYTGDAQGAAIEIGEVLSLGLLLAATASSF